MGSGLEFIFFKERHGHVQLTLMKGHHHIVTSDHLLFKTLCVCACVCVCVCTRVCVDHFG